MGVENKSAGSDVLLVKIRPSNQLQLAERRFDLEPLHDSPLPAAEGFGVDSTPQWYLTHLEGSEKNPWDQAHTRLANKLGINESDILFAEPDLVHSIYVDGSERPAEGESLAVGEQCKEIPQDKTRKKGHGTGFAWHLDTGHSQLQNARETVQFQTPRTRIAHIDTGYWRAHKTKPRNINESLERNFVEKDGNFSNAEDPDNWRFLMDNSGHGTGTIGILAGGSIPAHPDFDIGGAPGAEIVPLRISDRVALIRTSALARAIRYAASIGCQVATLSMGGSPSKAWGEAVDEAYLSGLCICAAAGNHYSISPPRKLVYPARYDRVIAVCGVMADGRPYADLSGLAMEGSFGPDYAMETAIAAYTPNIPWAVFGCEDIAREDGEGTSSATPQVAAAAALWIEKYKSVLPKDWRRVEAVRHALFSSAKAPNRKTHFGNGILQARKALDVLPVLDRERSKESDSSFGFLRVLTGIGIDQPTAREEMFNIELAQRWLLSDALQKIVPDPDTAGELPVKKMKEFMDAVIEDPESSLALRKHVISRYPVAAGQPVPKNASVNEVRPVLPPVAVQKPEIPKPPYRRIRVYATDPSLSIRLDTADSNEVTLKVRWENLAKGPVGEHLEVSDHGPQNYEGVNLDSKLLLAQDGWAPSEGNPQFHQQMVYAVAMKTIEHFERSLGRPVLWKPRPNPEDEYDDSNFVRRLVIRPHALQEANAYYSPKTIELLFGYFEAPADPGYHLPGSPVYTCLSHDIIAHETTHAILDGMYRRFNEPTNLDVLAFHEAFSDIVALLQHFTIPGLLEREISRTRGDLEAESLLGSLAIQFGRTQGRGALRSAIGTIENGVWTRAKPDPNDLARKVTPHARGAVLVGAVFDALISIYNQRIADLLRIYTGGTGVLPSGAIHPDLVGRLAGEASKSANHVLGMCIRALDFLPPVDVTFFDFLRALITADFEMVTDDRHNYRVAFVEAFSKRAIFPGDHDDQAYEGARALSVDTLRWQGFDEFKIKKADRKTVMKHYKGIVGHLKKYADESLYINDREKLFKETRRQRIILRNQLKAAFEEAPEFAESLGLIPGRSFEVHALRRATRVRLDGRAAPQVFVALTQAEKIDATDNSPEYVFRGGSTLVVDLAEPDLPKYRIRKGITNPRRRTGAMNFVNRVHSDPLRRIFFSSDNAEPFAALHSLTDEG